MQELVGHVRSLLRAVVGHVWSLLGAVVSLYRPAYKARTVMLCYVGQGHAP